jgi:hypothetical protein
VGKKKRKIAVKVVPRLGPATNLRPAGAHESAKLYDRKKLKAALRRDDERGFDDSRSDSDASTN